jgi:8-oxo-dGTP pyrophosphatase MutT (NUDIX family)
MAGFQRFCTAGYLPRMGVRRIIRRAARSVGRAVSLSSPIRQKLFRQSGVIPYRRRRDGQLEVLLITSRRSGQWIVPKGLVEPDMTEHASAAKEAREEAGVVGTVGTRAVGAFEYEKWGGVCHVSVFDLHVTSELDAWPEKGQRDRRWVDLAEAEKLVSIDDLARMIERLPKRIGGNSTRD